MARQVFFDPFGSYTRGFDAGAVRQTGLEDSVRRARAQDYDFNVLQPYRTAAIQRADQLDTRAQPYKIKSLPIGYQNELDNMYGNQLSLAQRGAQTFNIPDPLYDVGRRAFGLQFGTTDNGAGGQATTIYAHGPDGRLYPVSQQANYGQSVLDNGANFERNLQLQQLQNMQLLYGARGQYYTGDAIARQEAAQAAMLRAQHGAYGNTGYGGYGGYGVYAPSGLGFAGFGGGYDPTQAYNLPQQ